MNPPPDTAGNFLVARASGWRAWAPWAGVVGLALAGAAVFWVFDALPFQDLPAHAGLIALRHRITHSAFERRFYVVEPHLGPYSLFRFLGEVFIGPLGAVGAVRALATLPMAATPLALVWARHRLHGDRSPGAAFFGLALGFGFMTLLGFASYLLGIAVLIVALTMWLELLWSAEQRDVLSPRREIVMACAAPVVLLAHGHAFVLFLALAAVSTLVTGHRARRVVCLRCLVPGVAFAAWVAWRERASALPRGSVSVPQAGLALHFQGVFDKLSLLVTPTLLTRTGIDVMVGLALWTVVLTATFATARTLRTPIVATTDPSFSPLLDRASRSHSRSLLGCLIALTSAFAMLPHSVGWFGFVDGRLVPLLLFLAIMAVRRPALGRRLQLAFECTPAVAAAAMVALAWIASLRFQSEAAGWREVLAAVPAQARLLNLPIDPNSDIFTAHPFVHYDKLVVTERPAIVSDVWFHQGSAIFPTAENPSLRLPATYSESDLRFVDWGAYRWRDWDYVLMRTRPTAPEPEVPRALLVLAEHRGGWWLYRTRLIGDPHSSRRRRVTPRWLARSEEHCPR